MFSLFSSLIFSTREDLSLCPLPGARSLRRRKKAKKSQESLQTVWSARTVPSVVDVALNSWLDKYVIGLLHHWGIASKIVCFIIIHFCTFFFFLIEIFLIEISYVLLLRWWAEISFAFAKLNYFPKVFLNFHADATENSKRVKSC